MNILLWQFPWENLFFSIDKGKLKKTQVALKEYKDLQRMFLSYSKTGPGGVIFQ